jgi:hypothetical protein
MHAGSSPALSIYTEVTIHGENNNRSVPIRSNSSSCEESERSKIVPIPPDAINDSDAWVEIVRHCHARAQERRDD